jgi:prophage DNA circulation protein
MSWAQTLQDASFRGVPFEVTNTSDQASKTVAVHQRPYMDGAELEDMGNDPDTIEVRAMLRGPAYEQALQALRKALQTNGPGELVHPIFGALTVVATHWSIDHEADVRDACALSIRFMRHRLAAPVFAQAAASTSADRVATLGDQARALSAEAIATKVSAIAASPLPRVTEINAAFASAKAKLRKLLDTTSVRTLLADLDPLVYPRAALGDLQAIVNDALAGLPLGGLNAQFDGLVDTVSASAALSDFNRLTQAQDTAVTVAPTSTEPQDIEVSAGLTAHCRVLNATMTATAACLILAGEGELLELERADIERLAAVSRTGLQSAITAARTSLDAERGAQVASLLAEAAHEMQASARAALEQHPPVVTRVAPIGGTARLLAHAFYGDATRAPELMRLNRLGRQVLIDAGEEVQAYAR